jgi:hypothetical protein
MRFAASDHEFLVKNQKPSWNKDTVKAPAVVLDKAITYK